MITATDIKTYCPELPEGIENDDPIILSCIDYVEKTIIEKYLGIDFYKKIKDYKTTIDADNSATQIQNLNDLINGVDYTYSDILYNNPGLIEVFSRFAFAQYIYRGGALLEQAGLQEYAGGKTKQASYAIKKDRYNEFHQIAVIQANKLRSFIMRNDYDEYSLYCPGVPRSRTKIQIIR